ncbi:MAG: L-histidine N(alpha)-methyltransferase [Candidatus Eisenbacteria bacterium]
MVHSLASSIATSTFADDVRAGLTLPRQKELLSKYLYDDVGSTLFDAICLLAEYGLTRADARLLSEHADEIVARMPRPTLVAELGSGSGKKTRFVLQALALREPVLYHPIDISGAALEQSEKELGAIDRVSVVGFEAEYLDGLAAVAARRTPGQKLLVLFLGSTIGNFDRPAGQSFLARVRDVLEPGDRLLLSTDLIKPEAVIVRAYDDPVGVTAAFNRNLLARINRELGGDFDLSRWVHKAVWNGGERRIEMHLVSTVAQTVHVAASNLAVDFMAGETIWTESSHKYTAREVRALADRTGYRCEAQWCDQEWAFAQSLLEAC